jgi:hypothetical protein
MYRVYYLGMPVQNFRTRDAALDWINVQDARGYSREDYEILDGSDFL